MDDKQIRYFIKLYETKNMHKAAEELYISQQGLSKSILALEKDLRVQLFMRDVTGTIPTEAGEYFYKKMQPLRNQIMQIRKNTRIVGGGRVQIRVPYTFGSMEYLYPVFESYLQQHPDIDLHLAQASDAGCQQELMNNQAALAIACILSKDSDFVFIPLYSCPIVCLSNTKDKKVYDYHDLNNKQIVIAGDAYAYTNYLREQLIHEMIDYHVLMNTTDMRLVKQLLSKQDCYVILPELYAKELENEYHMHTFTDDHFQYELGIIYRKEIGISGIYNELIDYLFLSTQ